MPKLARSIDQAVEELPASFEMGFAWYVVYANINCEARAAMGLTAKRFAVFLPTYAKKIKSGRKLVDVVRPLFPRYLFVGFDINRDPWTEVRLTNGVESLVSNNEIPMRVPPGIVEEIQWAQVAGEFDLKKPPPAKSVEIGDVVPITAGPFRDFVVEVTAAPDEHARVEILLKILGSTRRIKIALADLAPVNHTGAT